MANAKIRYLSQKDFDKFVNSIPKLKLFRNKQTRRSDFQPNQFQLLCKLMYYCALKTEEALELKKIDFDFDNRILTIRNANTHLKKTTIPPHLIRELSTYLKKTSQNKPLFKISRQTLWAYVKLVGEFANLQLSGITKSRKISGAYTLLFRHSYQQQMRMLGADDDLTNLKLRSKSETDYGGYDYEDLKNWEEKNYKVEYLPEEEIKNYCKWYSENLHFYEKFRKSIENVIREILNSENAKSHFINSRAKSLESFEKKIRDAIGFDPKMMQDLAGVRIICYVKDDVEKICRIIESNFDIDELRSRNKSKVLEENEVGYRTIQYVAKFPDSRTGLTDFKKYKDQFFEIQVRTILQHAWAEIQHDSMYKNLSLPKQLRRRYNLISGMLEVSDNEFQELHNQAKKYT